MGVTKRMKVLMVSCFITSLSQMWGKQYLVETEDEEIYPKHHGSEVGEDYGEDNEDIESLMYERFSKAAIDTFEAFEENHQKRLVGLIKEAVDQNYQKDYNDMGIIDAIKQMTAGSKLLLRSIQGLLKLIYDNPNMIRGERNTTKEI